MVVFFPAIQDKLQAIDRPGLIVEILKAKSADRALGLVPHSKGWYIKNLASELLVKPWRTAPFTECACIIIEKLGEILKLHNNAKLAVNVRVTKELAKLAFDEEIFAHWMAVIRHCSFNYI